MLAGGGIQSGGVYGASDRIASTHVRDPVSPDDLLATIYDRLGMSYGQMLYDLEQRPIKTSEGTPVAGLLA